jgi:hypothetical protein
MSRTGWRKASKSGGAQNSDCVEARSAVSGFQVRDSKLGECSPILNLGAADFTGLLRAAGRDLTSHTPRARALRVRARLRRRVRCGSRSRAAAMTSGWGGRGFLCGPSGLKRNARDVQSVQR